MPVASHTALRRQRQSAISGGQGMRSSGPIVVPGSNWSIARGDSAAQVLYSSQSSQFMVHSQQNQPLTSIIGTAWAVGAPRYTISVYIYKNVVQTSTMINRKAMTNLFLLFIASILLLCCYHNPKILDFCIFFWACQGCMHKGKVVASKLGDK